jgi:hypothetical protein
MNLSLNPNAFPEPLVFEWFASDEGSTWEIALSRLLKDLDLEYLEKELVHDYVAQTLARVGKAKLRRHFEIRPISLGEEHSLVELRWLPRQLSNGPNLRLYAYLDFEGSRLIGLCFRQKIVGQTGLETNQIQNQDILNAIELAIRHKEGIENREN